MEFGFTQEQEMIRSQAADFLKNECPIAFVRESMNVEHGFSSGLWEKMNSMGWLGLIFPEEHGGAGLSFVELAIVLEEMGRTLAPGPFFSTVVLAGLTLLEAGSAEQKKIWLEPLAGGKLKGTLALLEQDGGWDASGISLRAERSGSGYVLNGTKLFVPDAHISDLILCVARTGEGAKSEDGVTILAIDRKSDGLAVSRLATLDMTRRWYEVSLDRVRVPASRVLGGVGRGWPVIENVLNKAAIGLSAEMAGGSARALGMSVEYSKLRFQFGRPIGSFQAIQHKCADMLLVTESAKSAVYAAAWAASQQGENLSLFASITKAYAGDAYTKVAGDAIQIHGGMGFTWENDAHLYFKRAKADAVTFGDASYHRERVAGLIGL
jgi:alkylation response protein AidB-like acyl-CoA dehydrogenase